MSEVNFGNDGDFSDEAMVRRVNNQLSNELGNLCQRTLSMVYKNCDKAFPVEIGPYTAEDEKLLETARSLHERTSKAVSVQAIQKYMEILISIIRDSNKYIDEQAPWVLKKTDPARMKTVLYILLEVLRYSAILYQPIIPSSSNRILDQLMVPNSERTFHCLSDAFRIRPGTPMSGKPVGIFPRIEIP